MAKLFSYGTLQQKKVQLANFGRELTDAELAQADDDEVEAYVRVKAILKSGTECWIYAPAEHA